MNSLERIRSSSRNGPGPPSRGAQVGGPFFFRRPSGTCWAFGILVLGLAIQPCAGLDHIRMSCARLELRRRVAGSGAGAIGLGIGAIYQFHEMDWNPSDVDLDPPPRWGLKWGPIYNISSNLNLRCPTHSCHNPITETKWK